ncbi:chorismate mutase [Tetragenococcus halophilus]|uniref:maltose acetyltransferase domain-containing protein n=1 Tax=Tetragenococcus halophilus TaxID=51669 RepID=UPI000CAAA2E0|nr:maltose acetyltransferase domain-containing protein [Tetragenococcus halophilus]MCO8284808.1 chorismate mutase [Tetragenococcus halophilus]MCO8294309.1 chorismate mutase [Tetragenococcus halophilus]NRR74871.1 chorismate mutase [Tetragenococcus halophilus]QXN86610.1 chorismate mutase [Tetragenococcus halophilus]RQD29544.1 maltose acetyltransferase [Tetragenococcus halophilus subsp. halophilus DSM 20339]
MPERSEKEKMIAGDLYFSADPELAADRKAARKKQILINHEDDSKRRNQRVKETFGSVGDSLHVEQTIRFDYGYNISVGENFYANYDCVLLDICPITIGDNCMLAPNVKLYTASHPLHPIKRKSGLEDGKPITIGNDVWIGGGSVIIPGVTLGDNVVVGAGSVVTKSYPDNVVIAGNPAKVIKTIELDPEEATPLEQQQDIIDDLDWQVVELLEKRIAAVSNILQTKTNDDTDFFTSERYEKILSHVQKAVTNPAYEEIIQKTFKDLLRHTQEMEEKFRD